MLGMDLPAYQPKNSPEYEPTRTRRLLLRKSQMKELATKGDQKGLTIIPISLYSKGTKIKVTVALVRGKKKFDKRETIKKRETGREVERLMKKR